MPNCGDAVRMLPDERLREAASVLAAGVLRLCRRAALPAATAPENQAKSDPTCLEVPDETVLSVHAG